MKYVIVPQSDIDNLRNVYNSYYKNNKNDPIIETLSWWKVINRKYTKLPVWLSVLFENLGGTIK